MENSVGTVGNFMEMGTSTTLLSQDSGYDGGEECFQNQEEKTISLVFWSQLFTLNFRGRIIVGDKKVFKR